MNSVMQALLLDNNTRQDESIKSMCDLALTFSGCRRPEPHEVNVAVSKSLMIGLSTLVSPLMVVWCVGVGVSSCECQALRAEYCAICSGNFDRLICQGVGV